MSRDEDPLDPGAVVHELKMYLLEILVDEGVDPTAPEVPVFLFDVLAVFVADAFVGMTDAPGSLPEHRAEVRLAAFDRFVADLRASIAADLATGTRLTSLADRRPPH